MNADARRKLAEVFNAAVDNYDSTRRDLAISAQRLGARLIDLAQSASNPTGFMPRTFGEIQGAGSDIDMLCAQFYERKRMVEVLAELIAAADKEQA